MQRLGRDTGTPPGATHAALERSYTFNSVDETCRFAASLAPHLNAGDAILLQGGLGAGKTHFARCVIQKRLATFGLSEDVPSPTFTLVQTYWDTVVELWHCDLYRLSGADDAQELGIDEAFDAAICLVEWPDRLGDLTPPDALSLTFQMTADPGVRLVTAVSQDARWAELLDRCGFDDGHE